jgi:hypothetical protein
MLPFMMLFHRISVGVKKIYSLFYRAKLVWQEDKFKKYHLVTWAAVCQPKEQGGLGMLNINLLNHALLTKWFWKLETEKGIRKTIA